MNPSSINSPQLAGASKRLARRCLALGENRLQLLVVEVQEERQHLLHLLLLAIGAAAFGLLAGEVLTVMMVVLLWATAPILVLLVLALLYAGAAAFLYRRLKSLRCRWKAFPATLDQLRKDRECLERSLS